MPEPPEKDWKFYLQTFGPMVAGGLAMLSGNPGAAGMAYGATQMALSPLSKNPYDVQRQTALGGKAMFGSYPYYRQWEDKQRRLPQAPGGFWDPDSWVGGPLPAAGYIPPPPPPPPPTTMGAPLSFGLPAYTPVQFDSALVGAGSTAGQ